MKVYIAGPMAGLPDHNFPAFHKEAARLRAMGYEVVSPAEGVPDADHNRAVVLGINVKDTQMYRDYLKRDLRLVLDCDAISLLEGWQNSFGANLEAHVAKAVGIEILGPIQEPNA